MSPAADDDVDGVEGCFPDAHYLTLASRLVPGMDGGFTVATLGRARQMVAHGARSPWILTLDPGTPEEHAAHRDAFVSRGDAADPTRFLNLFDEALADPSWLVAAAVPGEPTPGVEYRDIAGADGRTAVSIPVIPNNPDWHTTTANVVVHSADGTRVLRGFGGLYRAWLDHVVARVRESAPELPVVLVCESRQLGELLADWRVGEVCIVHTIHTSHLNAPYELDSAVGPLWTRWLAIADRFDAILWPTAHQAIEVERRFGPRWGDAVVPNAAPPLVTEVVRPTGHRAVLLARLAPVKRIHLAIEAWRLVRAAVPDAVLELHGDGPLRSELEALVAEYGLGDAVEFHGYRAGGASVFDGAAFALLTSSYEGQGLVTLEAMSRGCPAVVFDVRYGPREQVLPRGGRVIADGDVRALADACIELFEHEALRARLSAGALERAAAYQPETMMSAMGYFVRRALARPR